MEAEKITAAPGGMFITGGMLVLLLLVIALAFFIFLRRKSSVSGVNFGILTWWKTQAIVGVVYLIVLLLAVLFLPLLPSRHLAQPVPSRTNRTNLMSPPDPKVIFRLMAGQSPALGTRAYPDGIYQNSGQVFTLGRTENTTLHFNITRNIGSYINQIILVQKKDMKQRKIEAATFVTTSEINGIDFTERIAPPRISFRNGTLTVEPGPPQRLTYKAMESPSVERQFTEGSRGRATNGPGLVGDTRTTMGWQVIYLAVPKDLKIDKGKGNYVVTIQ